MKKIILFLTLSFATLTASSQNNSGNCPGWLWAVSGNGLAQKSYLFGTCHGDGHDFTKEELLGIPGIENALKEVKVVLFEGGMNAEMTQADSTEIVAEIEKLKIFSKIPAQNT